MGTEISPITVRLREMVADGEWHSREELLRIAQAARYADCTKPDTWFDVR